MERRGLKICMVNSTIYFVSIERVKRSEVAEK